MFYLFYLLNPWYINHPLWMFRTEIDHTFNWYCSESIRVCLDTGKEKMFLECLWIILSKTYCKESRKQLRRSRKEANKTNSWSVCLFCLHNEENFVKWKESENEWKHTKKTSNAYIPRDRILKLKYFHSLAEAGKSK